jgi:hypothetical protein
MKQQSLRDCSPMKRFLSPITCVFGGIAATLISSCARDAVNVPPDPVPSAGYGYRPPPVASQDLPRLSAPQYGPPPGDQYPAPRAY